MRQTPEIYSLFAPHRTSARRESTSASLRLARSRQAHQSLDAITIHHTPSHWPRPPPFRPCAPPVVSLEPPHGPAPHVDSHATAPRLACGIDASRASATSRQSSTQRQVRGFQALATFPIHVWCWSFRVAPRRREGSTSLLHR